MERDQIEVPGEGLDRPGALIRYGHWGRPLLAFPSESGRAWDLENNGMIDAVAGLIDAGRVKVYAVDAFDHLSWSNNHLPTEERAQRHGIYERWIHEHIVPLVNNDSPGHRGIVTTGVSMGAYHAVNFTLKRPDVFPVAVALSGSYDPTAWHPWGEMGEATYFNNPTAYVPGMEGDHLQWVRDHAQVLLVVGQGPFEVQPTRALPSTQHLGALLAQKGIPSETDVWGFDVAHDWPWWRVQLAHHLPRFL